MSADNDCILRVKNLMKEFPVQTGYFFAKKHGTIKAVDNVCLDVIKGETFGLVGESGCGKTTMGRIIAGLISPDSGKIIFEGKEIQDVKGESRRTLRRKIQIIFQDPLSSLNPRMSILDIVSEPLRIHNIVPKSKLKEEVIKKLEDVGLNATFLNRFPHQLSGGQRQRVLIARSLSLSPSFIVADEPVSALDVSIQAQIINMLESLREKIGFSCLFISHNLAVVRNISRRVAVMYLGRIVEIGPTGSIYRKPLHPYTKGLLESVPDITGSGKLSIIPGEPPDPLNIPPGCPFHPRCDNSLGICKESKPPLEEKSEGRFVACHNILD